MTTKILALADALGNLVRFVLLPGQRFDTVGVEPLIQCLSFGALIADKASDSNTIIADLNERGAKIVISQHPRRTKPIPLDAEMYKWRHLIENFFCKLKEFKRIAVRAPTKPTRASMPSFILPSSTPNESQQALDQVTCLMGKNEAGKSAILLALAALNPHQSTPAMQGRLLVDTEFPAPRRYAFF